MAFETAGSLTEEDVIDLAETGGLNRKSLLAAMSKDLSELFQQHFMVARYAFSDTFTDLPRK